MSSCQSFNPEFFPGVTEADPHILMVKELDTGDVHMHQGKDGCVVVRARDIAQVARMLELCARAAGITYTRADRAEEL